MNFKQDRINDSSYDRLSKPQNKNYSDKDFAPNKSSLDRDNYRNNYKSSKNQNNHSIEDNDWDRIGQKSSLEKNYNDFSRKEKKSPVKFNENVPNKPAESSKKTERNNYEAPQITNSYNEVKESLSTFFLKTTSSSLKTKSLCRRFFCWDPLRIFILGFLKQVCDLFFINFEFIFFSAFYCEYQDWRWQQTQYSKIALKNTAPQYYDWCHQELLSCVL